MIVLHKKEYIPGKGHMLIATVKGPIETYIGWRIEFEGELWEVVASEYLTKPVSEAYRDAHVPIGLIITKVE